MISRSQNMTFEVHKLSYIGVHTVWRTIQIVVFRIIHFLVHIVHGFFKIQIYVYRVSPPNTPKTTSRSSVSVPPKKYTYLFNNIGSPPKAPPGSHTVRNISRVKANMAHKLQWIQSPRNCCARKTVLSRRTCGRRRRCCESSPPICPPLGMGTSAALGRPPSPAVRGLWSHSPMPVGMPVIGGVVVRAPCGRLRRIGVGWHELWPSIIIVSWVCECVVRVCVCVSAYQLHVWCVARGVADWISIKIPTYNRTGDKWERII